MKREDINAKLSHNATDFLTNAVPSEVVDGHSIQLYYTTLLARECQLALNVSNFARNRHADRDPCRYPPQGGELSRGQPRAHPILFPFFFPPF